MLCTNLVGSLVSLQAGNLVDGPVQLRIAREMKASDAGAISKARRNEYADP